MNDLTARFDITDVVLVDGGKIEYYMKETNALFVFHNVKQVKGKGVADADHLTILSDKHKLVLNLLLELGWEKYTAVQIKKIVINNFKGKGETCDPNHYGRTISELYRRKLLAVDSSSPPHYSLIMENVKKSLETGKF